MQDDAAPRLRQRVAGSDDLGPGHPDIDRLTILACLLTFFVGWFRPYYSHEKPTGVAEEVGRGAGGGRDGAGAAGDLCGRWSGQDGAYDGGAAAPWGKGARDPSFTSGEREVLVWEKMR